MRLRLVTTLSVIGTLLAVTEASAIPAWARKYNMNCSGCHYPAPPKLNEVGIRFRWAGYRMPNELGEAVTVDQVSNYIAAQGQAVYSLNFANGQSPISALDAADAKLWYMGPLGKHYLGWFEFEAMPDASLGLGAQVGGVWGNQRAYGGFRVGQGHFLFETGMAGFDRNVALTDVPLPLEGPTTAGVPFVFSDDRVGAEGFYVANRNRVSVQVLEPVAGLSPTLNSHKDFVLTDQFLLDGKGAGIQFTALYGSVLGVDSSAVGARSNYGRVAVSASHYLGNFELLGGVVLARDNDLPTGGTSPFTASSMKGAGYWVSGQYAVPRTPLALYGRYEFSDPNTSASSDATSRVVIGGIAPLTLPEYLRLNVEYTLMNPQSGSTTNRLAVGLTLGF
jgi:hypothetical protein